MCQRVNGKGEIKAWKNYDKRRIYPGVYKRRNSLFSLRSMHFRLQRESTRRRRKNAYQLLRNVLVKQRENFLTEIEQFLPESQPTKDESPIKTLEVGNLDDLRSEHTFELIIDEADAWYRVIKEIQKLSKTLQEKFISEQFSGSYSLEIIKAFTIDVLYYVKDLELPKTTDEKTLQNWKNVINELFTNASNLHNCSESHLINDIDDSHRRNMLYWQRDRNTLANEVRTDSNVKLTQSGKINKRRIELAAKQAQEEIINKDPDCSYVQIFVEIKNYKQKKLLILLELKENLKTMKKQVKQVISDHEDSVHKIEILNGIKSQYCYLKYRYMKNRSTNVQKKLNQVKCISADIPLNEELLIPNKDGSLKLKQSIPRKKKEDQQMTHERHQEKGKYHHITKIFKEKGSNFQYYRNAAKTSVNDRAKMDRCTETSMLGGQELISGNDVNIKEKAGNEEQVQITEQNQNDPELSCKDWIQQIQQVIGQKDLEPLEKAVQIYDQAGELSQQCNLLLQSNCKKIRTVNTLCYITRFYVRNLLGEITKNKQNNREAIYILETLEDEINVYIEHIQESKPANIPEPQLQQSKTENVEETFEIAGQGYNSQNVKGMTINQMVYGYQNLVQKTKKNIIFINPNISQNIMANKMQLQEEIEKFRFEFGQNATIIAPILFQQHWTCIITTKQESRYISTFFDSLGGQVNNQSIHQKNAEATMKITLGILGNINNQGIELNTYQWRETSQKSNNTCGYYCLRFIQKYLQQDNSPILEEEVKLIQHQLEQKNDLRFASDEDIEKFIKGLLLDTSKEFTTIYIDPQVSKLGVNEKLMKELICANNNCHKFANQNKRLKYIIIPICRNKHWTCVICQILKDGRIKGIYFDSIQFQQDNNQEALQLTNHILNILSEGDLKSEVTNLQSMISANQTDNYSCGYYVMLFIKRILNQQFCDIDQISATALMKEIYREKYGTEPILDSQPVVQSQSYSQKSTKSQGDEQNLNIYDCPFCENYKQKNIQSILTHCGMIQNNHHVEKLWEMEPFASVANRISKQKEFNQFCDICKSPLYNHQNKYQHKNNMYCKKAAERLGLDSKQNKQIKINKKQMKINPEIAPNSINQLSKNCSEQDGAALLLQAEIFNNVVKQNKENILIALNTFISKFTMKEPGNYPTTKNIQQEMKSIQHYVNKLMELGATGKCYTRCEEFVNQIPKNEALSEEKMKALFSKYHPENPNPIHIQNILDNQIINMPQISKIEQDEIEQEIKQLVKHKACGLSGIGPTHLKYLCRNNPLFIKNVTTAFNILFTTPLKLKDIPLLYQFRQVFIPKRGQVDAFRPIAICETLLLIFHKIITTKIRLQLQNTTKLENQISKHQFAFQKNAIVQCLRRAEQMRISGLILTQIDISNAFNSTPHEVIKNQMRKVGICPSYRAYFDEFLKNRFCKYSANIKCGVPQGDPQSMLLFCLAVNPVINELAQKENLVVIAYADDLLVGHSSEYSSKQIIQLCRQEFSQIGLLVNEEKCQSTENNGSVKFMGQTFTQHSPVSRSAELIQTAENCIKVIDNAPISLQQKFLLTSFIAVSKVNWGPLIEQSGKDIQQEKANYNKIDEIIMNFIQKIFDIDINTDELTEFCINHRKDGGLELMVPGKYYDTMKKVQSEYLNEIEDFQKFSFNIVQAEFNKKQQEEKERVKEQFMNQQGQVVEDNNFSIPKIAFALGDEVQMNDQTFKFLTWLRFGNQASFNIQNQTCPLCRQRNIMPDHIITCDQNNFATMIRHDKIVEFLVKNINRDRKPLIVCVENQNKHNSLLKPDLECIVQGKRVLLDVSFVRHEKDMERRFNEKVEKYINLDGIHSVEQIYPIIISYNGTLFEKSARLLQDNLPEIGASVFYKAIYREIANAWLRADQNTRQTEEMAMDKEILPMPGHYEYEDPTDQPNTQRRWSGHQGFSQGGAHFAGNRADMTM
uniref:Putative reverse transcriptase/endonuclease n=1 Tax=Trepomonas sp. PC1 TaxID=1076344 RepID=A0A146KLE3_9EUKA|eukprot:JAP96216.1 Putative reverse transcriptase/endonuclease [Trepomonas sp. PC1]